MRDIFSGNKFATIVNTTNWFATVVTDINKLVKEFNLFRRSLPHFFIFCNKNRKKRNKLEIDDAIPNGYKGVKNINVM